MGEGREGPGPQQVDAVVRGAADALEGEVVGRQGGEDGVLVVGALVDRGLWGEVGARGVGEEGGQVVVGWGSGAGGVD